MLVELSMAKHSVFVVIFAPLETWNSEDETMERELEVWNMAHGEGSMVLRQQGREQHQEK
jgi:hypothetical protein